MSHFCLLADPGGYRVSDADLLTNVEERDHWMKLFEDHFAVALESARATYGRGATRQLAAAQAQFVEVLAALKADPASAGGRLGVLELCRMREKALRDHGLHDPFLHVKVRENRTAIEMYPAVMDELAGVPHEQRWERLVRGVFAGNIFDLGSSITMGFTRDRVDFQAALAEVRPRPWQVDDFDSLLADLPQGAEPACWGKAVVFVDNAGADFVLGVMPMVRQLAGCGVHIVLAANELPSLNDLTADETVEIVEEISRMDRELAGYIRAGLFEVVSTGNDLPLIDLSEVSDELNEAAADADLVFVVGMGRGVESNLDTAFAVDSLQVCLLKDPLVAARIGGQVYDCVCMYRPVGAAEAEADAAPAAE